MALLAHGGDEAKEQSHSLAKTARVQQAGMQDTRG